MTITVTREKVKEVTREDVDRAIDVIERHLEKEARTRNLLDEQAIMRPRTCASSRDWTWLPSCAA